MHFYRVLDIDADPAQGLVDWYPTMADAHRDAKRRFCTGHARSRCRIELVEIDTSKDGVLGLLRTGAPPCDSLPALRTWGLTDRGGLRELPKGE